MLKFFIAFKDFSFFFPPFLKTILINVYEDNCRCPIRGNPVNNYNNNQEVSKERMYTVKVYSEK